MGQAQYDKRGTLKQSDDNFSLELQQPQLDTQKSREFGNLDTIWAESVLYPIYCQ